MSPYVCKCQDCLNAGHPTHENGTIGEGYKLPEHEGAPPAVETLAKLLFARKEFGDPNVPVGLIDWMEAGFEGRSHFRAMAEAVLKEAR